MRSFACIFIVFLLALPLVASAEDPVIFPDANLQAAVEEDVKRSDVTLTVDGEQQIDLDFRICSCGSASKMPSDPESTKRPDVGKELDIGHRAKLSHYYGGRAGSGQLAVTNHGADKKHRQK